MTNIFEAVPFYDQDDSKGKSVALGVRVQIGGNAVTCPISKECVTSRDLESQVEDIKGMLDKALAAARACLGTSDSQGTLSLSIDMSSKEIWEVLSGQSDDALFIETFNEFDEEKRREVADYVLSNCNTFSGRGALFSARYDNKSGLIE